MKRVLVSLLASTLVLGWASACLAAGVMLTIHDGRVSLDAQDVTIRQILTEWARVGKTQIVNLERVTSGPVTIKFDGLTEDAALDIILRALPGYMAAPRASQVADASIYDRIVILATTTAVAAPPIARGQTPLFSDQGSNVTQLRPATQPFNPGISPQPPDDPRNSNDPAIIAAAAAGLTAVPAPQPGGIMPSGPLQMPPAMILGTPLAAPQPPSPATTVPLYAPAGASRPGPAPATPPASPLNPPPDRAVGVRPPQADR